MTPPRFRPTSVGQPKSSVTSRITLRSTLAMRLNNLWVWLGLFPNTTSFPLTLRAEWLKSQTTLTRRWGSRTAFNGSLSLESVMWRDESWCCSSICILPHIISRLVVNVFLFSSLLMCEPRGITWGCSSFWRIQCCLVPDNKFARWNHRNYYDCTGICSLWVTSVNCSAVVIGTYMYWQWMLQKPLEWQGVAE